MSSIQHNSIEADAILTELRERCAFYERTNAEQAAILNRVIAERDTASEQLAALRLKCDEAITACASETCAMASERDDYRAALEEIYAASNQAEILDLVSVVFSKFPFTEDEVEQALRMV